MDKEGERPGVSAWGRQTRELPSVNPEDVVDLEVSPSAAAETTSAETTSQPKTDGNTASNTQQGPEDESTAMFAEDEAPKVEAAAAEEAGLETDGEGLQTISTSSSQPASQDVGAAAEPPTADNSGAGDEQAKPTSHTRAPREDASQSEQPHGRMHAGVLVSSAHSCLVSTPLVQDGVVTQFQPQHWLQAEAPSGEGSADTAEGTDRAEAVLGKEQMSHAEEAVDGTDEPAGSVAEKLDALTAVDEAVDGVEKLTEAPAGAEERVQSTPPVSADFPSRREVSREWLRPWLVENGMTQSGMCRTIGVNPADLSLFLHGRYCHTHAAVSVAVPL